MQSAQLIKNRLLKKGKKVIASKKDLYGYLSVDNDWLRPKNFKTKMIERFLNYPSFVLRKYLLYLRKQEYYINTAGKSKLKGLLGLYYERKKNTLGLRLGIEIGPNCFGKGLQIYHTGSIIVNSAVKAGENVKLHGSNCIGNNGKTEKVPRLGNNVDIGYGAVVIGDIVIADNVTIGANAVVNRSILEEGCTVAGIPARIISKKLERNAEWII